jgi:uncharacterized lipoprotein YmbA
MALSAWLLAGYTSLARKEFGMSSKKRHKIVLVAAALVVAGCSSTGTEGQTTTLPGPQPSSKQSAQEAAEERQREVTQATRQRQAKLEQAARAALEEARAEQTKLNEAATTRLDAESTP